VRLLQHPVVALPDPFPGADASERELSSCLAELGPAGQWTPLGFWLNRRLVAGGARDDHPAGAPELAWFLGAPSRDLWVVWSQDAAKQFRVVYARGHGQAPKAGRTLKVQGAAGDIRVRVRAVLKGGRSPDDLLRRLAWQANHVSDDDSVLRQWRVVELRAAVEVLGDQWVSWAVCSGRLQHEDVCTRLLAAGTSSGALFSRLLRGVAAAPVGSVMHARDGHYDRSLTNSLQALWSKRPKRKGARPALAHLGMLDGQYWWFRPESWAALRALAQHDDERLRMYATMQYAKAASLSEVCVAARDDRARARFTLLSPGRQGKAPRAVRQAIGWDMGHLMRSVVQADIDQPERGPRQLDAYAQALRMWLRKGSFLNRPRSGDLSDGYLRLVASAIAATVAPEVDWPGHWPDYGELLARLWQGGPLALGEGECSDALAYLIGRMAVCDGRVQGLASDLVFGTPPPDIDLRRPRLRRLYGAVTSGAARTISEGLAARVDHRWWWAWYRRAVAWNTRFSDPDGRLANPVVHMASGHASQGCEHCVTWLKEAANEMADGRVGRRGVLASQLVEALLQVEGGRDLATAVLASGRCHQVQRLLPRWEAGVEDAVDRGRLESHQEVLGALVEHGNLYTSGSKRGLSPAALAIAWHYPRTSDALLEVIRSSATPRSETNAALLALRRAFSGDLAVAADRWREFPAGKRHPIASSGPLGAPQADDKVFGRLLDAMDDATHTDELAWALRGLTSHWLLLGYGARPAQIERALDRSIALLALGVRFVRRWSAGLLAREEQVVGGLLGLVRLCGYCLADLGFSDRVAEIRTEMVRFLEDLWVLFPEVWAQSPPAADAPPHRPWARDWREALAPWVDEAAPLPPSPTPWQRLLASVGAGESERGARMLKDAARSLKDCTQQLDLASKALWTQADRLLLEVLNQEEEATGEGDTDTQIVWATVRSMHHLIEVRKWEGAAAEDYRAVVARVAQALADLAGLLAFRRSGLAYRVSTVLAKVPASPSGRSSYRQAPGAVDDVVEKPVLQLRVLVFLLAEIMHNAELHAQLDDGFLVLELDAEFDDRGRPWRLTIDEPDVSAARVRAIQAALAGEPTARASGGGRGLGLIQAMCRACGLPEATGGTGLHAASNERGGLRWYLPLRSPKSESTR